MSLILSGDTGPSFVQVAALPARSVLQTIISADTGTVILTNASGGQASQFGFGISSRAYGDLVNVTITPKYASSKLVIICHCGHTSGIGSTANLGAWGMVLVKDGVGYQLGDYPWYSGAGSWAGATGAYPPDTHLKMVFDAGSTSTQTWYLKGWVYSEGNSGTTRFIKTSMTVLEVAT